MSISEISRFEAILGRMGIGWMAGDWDLFDCEHVVNISFDRMLTDENDSDMTFVFVNAEKYLAYLDNKKEMDRYDAGVAQALSRRRIDPFYQSLIF